MVCWSKDGVLEEGYMSTLKTLRIKEISLR